MAVIYVNIVLLVRSLAGNTSIKAIALLTDTSFILMPNNLQNVKKVKNLLSYDLLDPVA